MPMPRSLRIVATSLSLLFAAGAARAADADALTLARKIVASHGGAEKLLRIFRFAETFSMGGKPKTTDRISVIQPPNLWYVGNVERVAEENKGGVCHDVWMWTLAPLVHPQSTFELLPAQMIDGRAARGLKVGGSITPAMDVFFDAATDDLLKIEWKGEQFLFSAPVRVDGTRLSSRGVLMGKTGKERIGTELRTIERLTALPANLLKPERK